MPAGKATTINKWAKIFASLAFGWVMLDALANYFIAGVLGSAIQVNGLLPVFILLMLWFGGVRAIVPPAGMTLSLAFGVVGFAMGPLLVREISAYRYIELLGALCAFIVGYAYARWHEDEASFSRLLLAVVGMHVAVCSLALLKVAPSILPVTEQPWSYHGQVVYRPFIGTNSNFQVFYVFPIVLILVLPYQTIRFWGALTLIVGAMFVLARLQTRSGSLAFLGIALLCLLAPLRNKRLGRGKLVTIGIAGLVFLSTGLPWLLKHSDLLIARFVDTDYATGYGRLVGFTYLFEHLFDPLWWSPQGNAEFAQRYGGTGSDAVPHSNITAMFLEGGIIGLFTWLVLFLRPVLELTMMFLRNRLDPLATMILMGGLCMLVTQMSLNVPFFKQPWLWAGAVVGALYRSRGAWAAIKSAKSASDLSKPSIPPLAFGSEAGR